LLSHVCACISHKLALFLGRFLHNDEFSFSLLHAYCCSFYFFILISLCQCQCDTACERSATMHTSYSSSSSSSFHSQHRSEFTLIQYFVYFLCVVSAASRPRSIPHAFTAPSSSSSSSSSVLHRRLSHSSCVSAPPPSRLPLSTLHELLSYKYEHIQIEYTSSNSSLFVKMNRPQLHNAFNEFVIQELTHAFQAISYISAHENNNHNKSSSSSSAKVDEIHSVVLTGNGPSFSAGADLNWMKKMINYSQRENEEDATSLWNMLHSIYSCHVPVIARINGSAFGGGVGLIAACDIAVATQQAKFGLTVYWIILLEFLTHAMNNSLNICTLICPLCIGSEVGSFPCCHLVLCHQSHRSKFCILLFFIGQSVRYRNGRTNWIGSSISIIHRIIGW